MMAGTSTIIETRESGDREAQRLRFFFHNFTSILHHTDSPKQESSFNYFHLNNFHITTTGYPPASHCLTS
jgi:hypothetical protein